MTINLYATTDDNRVVNKTLSAIVSGLTVRPTEAVDIMSPTFIINYNSAYFAANYLYCDTLRRYYYINNIALETGQRMALHCSIDVLKTYAAALPDVKATVIRSASVGKPTPIQDKKLPIDPNRYELLSAKFPKSFALDINTACYVLVT